MSMVCIRIIRTDYRGFHAMQARESRSCALSRRGPQGDSLRIRSVGRESSLLTFSVNMMRENCLAEFDAHWKCLEQQNQVGANPRREC